VVFQWCTYGWSNNVQRAIQVWCGSKLARKSFRAPISQLPQNEDVYTVRCNSDEFRNYIKLLWCKVSWKLSWYTVRPIQALVFFLYCCHPLEDHEKNSLYNPFFRYQFIPQMIFLNSLFGYLALLIIIKWSTGSQADLYHVMIYMFLSPTDDLGDNQLFWGQKLLQVHTSLLHTNILWCYFIFLLH